MKATSFIGKNVFYTFFLLSFISHFGKVYAQQHIAKSFPANDSKYNKLTGFFISLPADYATSGKNYPLIISLHGVGELAGANGTVLSDVVLNNGVPRVIKDGKFPSSFAMKGKSFSFIVATPQFKQWPGPVDVYNMLAYLKTQYRIDVSRCYLTGLSMGGGATWTSISENVGKARDFAAAVVMCGAYYDANRPQLPVNVASINMPVWATHNDGDKTVTVENSKRWVRDINAVVPAINPKAKLTIFSSSSHDAWTKTSDPNFRDEESKLNMYEWMLQYYRNPDGTIAFTEEDNDGSTEPPPVPPTGNKRINVPITSGTRMYYDDVMKNLDVKPGDTLCIPAGDYDYIRFAKIVGTPEKPVIIRNCGGLVRIGIRSTTTIAAFILSDCKYFKIEGDGMPGLKYGFDINGTNQNGIKMYGMIFSAGSTDFDVHHAYIHDASMFIQAKTLQNCDHPEWLDGQFTMKNVGIHDLLCRRANWEGFYIGNSHYLWNAGSCIGMKSHLVENLQVYNNDLEDMGWDGIQIALATNGDNRVYNNRVNNYGLARNSAQGYGILCGGGSSLRIFNNVVSKGFNAGVEIFGSGISHVYNNLITDIEYEGINVADKLLFEPATAYIYNNTVYHTGKNGIKIYADLTTIGHKVYNNIVIAEGTQWDTPQSGYYIKGNSNILYDFDKNFSFKTLDAAGFTDNAGNDFRLKQGAQAIDAGRNMADLSLNFDLDGKARPYNNNFDGGAYEYSGISNIAPIADAGNNMHVTASKGTVVLDGSKSRDADGSITSYAWTKVSGPVPGTISQGNTANANLTGLVAGAYVFELKVTDNQGATGTQKVSVTVTPGDNQQAVLVLSNDITVQLPSSSAFLASSDSYDPDGMIVSREWKKISGPAAGQIETPASSITNVTGLTEGQYVFEITVIDDGGLAVKGKVTVSVIGTGPVNKNPIARAGTDRTINLPANSVSLDGSASSDEDGTIASFIWEKISGPNAQITGANTAKASVTEMEEGEYVFELTVTDDKGATAKDEVKVIVVSVTNNPPIANAGADLTITLPDNVMTLNGDGSSDNDGTIVKYAWRKISGPSAVIQNPDVVSTNVVDLVEGTFVFELRVTDDKGLSATDQVKVVVLPAANIAPMARAGEDMSIVLPANSVTLNGNGSEDEDGEIEAYAWRKVSGPAGEIENPGAMITRVGGLQEGTYVFELTVTDNNGLTAKDQVKVFVMPVPNKVPVANAGSDISIILPDNQVSLNGAASSDEDGTIVTYSWKKLSGTDASIASPGTSVTTVSGLSAGVYEFELTVTDNKGGVAADVVKVTVLPAQNKPPVADPGINITITLPENSATLDGSASFDPDGNISAYSWRKVSGPQEGDISNERSALITITNLHEGTYIYELTVRDDKGLIAARQVSVSVLKQANQVPQANAGTDQTITLPVNTITLNGSASRDTDGSIISYLWELISGPSNVQFSAAGAAINTVSGMKVGQYIFQLTVTDDRNAIHSARVNVTVLPEVPVINLPPVAVVTGPVEIVWPEDNAVMDGSQSYGVDKSIVQYSWSQVSGPVQATIISPSQPFTRIINLTVAGAYVFDLTVKDEAGLTNTARYSVSVVDDKANKEELVTVYPVPANTFFYVDIDFMPEETDLILYLYNMEGKIVKEVRLPQMTPVRKKIEIDDLPTGYLLLEVKGKKGFRWTTKIIKVK